LLLFFDRFHWLWLLLAAPFLVFPSPKRSLALIVIPAVWILYVIQYKIENRKLKNKSEIDQPATINLQPSIKSGFPITSLNISVLVLAVMLLVSLWATYSIEQSLEKITGLVLGLGVFYAVVRESRRPGGWWRSVTVFLLGGLAWAGLGFLSMDYQTRFSFLTPVVSCIPRLIQDLPGPDLGLQHNAVGGTILWYLPMLVGLSWILKKYKIENIKNKIEGWVKGKKLSGIAAWGIRFIVWLGTIFMGLVLLLTQSRGGYLAFGLTGVGFLILVLRRKGRLILSGVAVLGFSGVMVWMISAGGWDAWIEGLGLAGQTGYSLETIGSRLEIWTRAIYGLEDFPLTGMGMNTFREVVHVLYPFFNISPDLDIAHAHNEFLQVGLDLGLPGMIAFISIYLIAFWTLLETWRAAVLMKGRPSPVPSEAKGGSPLQKKWNQDPLLIKTIVLGLGGGLFGHMVFGMLDAISLGAKPGIFFWILLALIVGLFERVKNIKYRI